MPTKSKSILPATPLPNIPIPGGNSVQATLETDVLVSLVLVIGAILYARRIPQNLWTAIVHSPNQTLITPFSPGQAQGEPTGPNSPNQLPITTGPNGQPGYTVPDVTGFGPGTFVPTGPAPSTPSTAPSTPSIAPPSQTVRDTVTSAQNALSGVITSIINQVVVPPGSDATTFQAGGSIDPQPGGIVGAAPFSIPQFRSCWSLPDGSTVGVCNG